MSTNPALDPSTKSAAYKSMLPAWQKINTLLAGTEAMRSAGEEYLPRYEAEEPEAYEARLLMATLLNQTKQTLDSWVGRPFRKQVQIGQDVPEDMRALFEDVDLQGNSLAVFARNWFREGVSKSFAHILVDYPTTYREGQTRTLRDDATENLRPYWCFVPPESVIFATAEHGPNGQEYLSHVRIKEQVVERDGFSEKIKEQIRVYERLPILGTTRPGIFYSIWEKQKTKRGGKEVWVLIQPQTFMDVDVIPLVTFYADRCGLMQGKPPLEDLADLNISHWQSSADQRNILSVARFPILAVSGVDEDEDGGQDGKPKKKPIGPRKVLSTPEPSGRWYYVEHAGNAIAAGRQDLQDLEEKMGHYGAEYLTRRPGSTSATARALDEVGATSPLQDAALRFNDALNQLLVITGKWMKKGPDEVGQVMVSTDFGPESGDAADASMLNEARTRKDISRITLVREMKRRGTLAEDYDEAKDKKELDAEPKPPAPAVPKKEPAPVPAAATE